MTKQKTTRPLGRAWRKRGFDHLNAFCFVVENGDVARHMGLIALPTKAFFPTVNALLLVVNTD